MKVGDLIMWRARHMVSGRQVPAEVLGTVLETKPTLPPRGEIPGIAVLTYMPTLPESEQWFHEDELEIVSEI